MTFDLASFNPHSFEPQTLAALWNAACGNPLALNARLVQYNTRPPQSAAQGGWLARRAGEPVGFALASAYWGDPGVAPPDLGWIDALAVTPDAQGGGAGSTLLAQAEAWLAGMGCTSVRLGGGIRRFVPGLPVELNRAQFFIKRGYRERAENARVWDVARNLGSRNPRNDGARNPRNVEVRAARREDDGALHAFFAREFPGRWRFEFEQYLRDGGDIGDYTILIGEREIDAFCQVTFEQSLRPIELFYMHRQPRPWGQLGPLGVSADRRALGYGAAIIEGALERLIAAGVRGCLVDWTHLLNFYARFGFAPYREYVMLAKSLSSHYRTNALSNYVP